MNELLIHLSYIQEVIWNKPITTDHIRVARNNIPESSLELIK